jgi:RNA polymerase sigma factor (sigma-70 family)
MTSQPPEDDVPDYIVALRKRLGITPRTTDAWLEALLQRDEKAWNDLKHICLDSCIKKLYKYQLPEHLYEDTALDALISTFDRIQKKEPFPDIVFEIYVLAVCNHKCIDIWRESNQIPIETDQKTLAQQRTDSSIHDITNEQPDTSDLDELIWILLQTCVQRFKPDKQRLAEAYFQGKGPKEIAREQGPGIPEGRISKQWFDVRKKINNYLDKCEAQLSQVDRVLFGLYLDRSKNKYRKKKDETSIAEEQSQVEKDETSTQEEQSQVRTTWWVLRQLMLIKDAADREDHARLITLQEQYMLRVPLEGVALPTPLVIDWVTGQLGRILRDMCNCIQGLR